MSEQLEVKGAERIKIPTIDRAASAFVTVRDERMELTKKESAKKAVLIQAVKDALKERTLKAVDGVVKYLAGNGKMVTFTTKEGVVVRDPESETADVEE